MISGVLLAAGLSRRFRSRKLLHEIAGQPLIYYSLTNCLRADLDMVWVVVGPKSRGVEDTIRRLFPDQNRIRIISNPAPERGQMSSVKLALAAIPDHHDAAMIFLADMPFVGPAVTSALVEAFKHSAGIVIPECDGVRRHPRLIPRRLFREFAQLDDSARGTQVFDRFADQITVVPVEDQRQFLDVDYPADLD